MSRPRKMRNLPNSLPPCDRSPFRWGCVFSANQHPRTGSSVGPSANSSVSPGCRPSGFSCFSRLSACSWFWRSRRSWSFWRNIRITGPVPQPHYSWPHPTEPSPIHATKKQNNAGCGPEQMREMTRTPSPPPPPQRALLRYLAPTEPSAPLRLAATTHRWGPSARREFFGLPLYSQSRNKRKGRVSGGAVRSKQVAFCCAGGEGVPKNGPLK